jgi:small GTP-binding protein
MTTAQPMRITPEGYPSAKVILVGNSGVGKTCLISAFNHDRHPRSPAPTVAPSFVAKPVQRTDGSTVVLQVWDTAGQERFASVSQLFFRDARVALLCFDAREQTSVEAVPEWVRRIEAEVQGCTMFAVMTKADKYPAAGLCAAFQNAKVRLASGNFESFFITSSVSRDGVDAVFIAAADAAVAGHRCEVRKTVPVQKEKCC